MTAVTIEPLILCPLYRHFHKMFLGNELFTGEDVCEAVMVKGVLYECRDRQASKPGTHQDLFQFQQIIGGTKDVVVLLSLT